MRKYTYRRDLKQSLHQSTIFVISECAGCMLTQQLHSAWKECSRMRNVSNIRARSLFPVTYAVLFARADICPLYSKQRSSDCAGQDCRETSFCDIQTASIATWNEQSRIGFTNSKLSTIVAIHKARFFVISGNEIMPRNEHRTASATIENENVFSNATQSIIPTTEIILIS
jgi:hypothetical protein